MNKDLEFINRYLSKQPKAAEGETKGAAEEFLNKPVSGSGVTVDPGKALPDNDIEHVNKFANEKKSIKQHAKEALVPKVRKIADTKERATKILGAAVPDVTEVPVPTGGIGLLVFIALVMVFAISAVNPKDKNSPSRLQLLWGTMLGNYSIKKASASGGGGGGGSMPSAPALPNGDFFNSVVQGSAT